MRACAGRLIPVEGPAVRRLLADAPYYAPATIQSEHYSGHAQEVPTSRMMESELIDAQNGGVIGLVAEELGDENVEVAGRQLRAVCYRGITPNAAGQLWYAADQLVKVRLEVRGETVDYRLVV